MSEDTAKTPYASSAPEVFLRPYNHLEHEAKRYEAWEKSGYFNPDNLPFDSAQGKPLEPFCIIMPPPNANGSMLGTRCL
jgi:valyl-tRNA synthetase